MKTIKEISIVTEILYNELIYNHNKIQSLYEVEYIEHFLRIIDYHSKIILEIDNKIADLKNELKELINK